MNEIIREKNKKNTERLLFVLVILLVFIMAARTPLDTDLFWHLSAGRVTAETGKPLMTDIFSFTRAGTPWVNHSWLAELILFGIFQWAGYLGLGILVGLSAAAMMIIAYSQYKKQGFMIAFLILLSSVVCSPLWAARPQILSLLMFSILSWLLWNIKDGKINLVKWLPLLFVIWGNLHGGYALGFILMGGWFAGELVNHILGLGGLARKDLLKVFLWFIASGFAVLVNPNGIQTWLIPFQTVGVRSLQQTISEWMSPDFHQISQQPFLWMILLVIGVFALRRKPVDARNWIPLLIFTAMGLIARRNMAPFALLAAPILAQEIDGILEDWRRPAWLQKISSSQKNQIPPIWLQKGVNFLLVIMLGFAAFIKIYIVTYPAFVEAHIERTFPVKALEWLQNNPMQGNMVNEYGWGGYLTWKAPEWKVFVDGRTDLFGDEVIGDWISLVNADDHWKTVADKWNIQWVLISPHEPIVPVLLNAGWKEEYRDSISVILGR